MSISFKKFQRHISTNSSSYYWSDGRASNILIERSGKNIGVGNSVNINLPEYSTTAPNTLPFEFFVGRRVTIFKCRDIGDATRKEIASGHYAQGVIVSGGGGSCTIVIDFVSVLFNVSPEDPDINQTYYVLEAASNGYGRGTNSVDLLKAANNEQIIVLSILYTLQPTTLITNLVSSSHLVLYSTHISSEIYREASNRPTQSFYSTIFEHAHPMTKTEGVDLLSSRESIIKPKIILNPNESLLLSARHVYWNPSIKINTIIYYMSIT